MAGMDGFNLSRFEQNDGELTDNIYKRTFLKKKTFREIFVETSTGLIDDIIIGLLNWCHGRTSH